MSEFKTLEKINCKKKRILLRVDLNIPLGNNLKISRNERWRIEAVLPTLKYLIKQKAKIVLISHLGRPNGRVVKKYSLKPVAEELSKLIKRKIFFSEKFNKTNTKKRIELMNYGDILMLENIRFFPGEEKKSLELAKNLASLGDFFVNDAFAVSHREHTSIVGIPKYLQSCAGPLIEKEIEELNKVLKKPDRPLVAIIGGAKISTKIKVINKLLKMADKVLIGGALANTIFCSQGKCLGDSLVEKDAFSEIKKINLENPKLFLPIDLALWEDKKVKYIEVGNKFKGKALDIGPKSIDLFFSAIKNAKTIIWNGPLGMFTQKPFDKSSTEIVKAIEKSKAHSIVGGGDTIQFLRKINKEKIFNYVSTGGGAMLDYLVYETLPGIEALR